MVTGVGSLGLRRTGASLAVFGLGHAAVDATCAALVFGAAAAGRIPASMTLGLFLLYNALAFALQPVAGLAADRLDAHRWAAVLGGVVTAAALAVSFVPGAMVAAVVAAGLGNAMFHVGGGAISIRLTPRRASAPGIFVAPGAGGLAAGTVLGRAGGALWVPAVTLIALAVAMALVRIPVWARPGAGSGHAPGTGAPPSAPGLLPRAEFGLALVLLVVALRSFTGLAIALPWRSAMPLLVALTTAVVFGKALGGVLADQFGRMRVGVGSLVLSAPLLLVAPTNPVAGLVGMLLFNMTMAVTLVAIADEIPDRPGFAFGLASLALVIGALPVLLALPVNLASPIGIALAVGASAVLLIVALCALNAEPAPASVSELPARLEGAE